MTKEQAYQAVASCIDWDKLIPVILSIRKEFSEHGIQEIILYTQRRSEVDIVSRMTPEQIEQYLG